MALVEWFVRPRWLPSLRLSVLRSHMQSHVWRDMKPVTYAVLGVTVLGVTVFGYFAMVLPQ